MTTSVIVIAAAAFLITSYAIFVVAVLRDDDPVLHLQD